MDFLKIVKSIEELLYEVMTWLVFYPRTMWLSVSRPLEMMEYSDTEQTEAPEKQYVDTLSPPLFLLLSIVIAHVIEVAAREKIVLGKGVGAEIEGSHEYLLALRMIIYSLFPLMFAIAVLRRQGHKIDRGHLRAPFFSQCYIAAPTALLVGLASVAVRGPDNAIALAGWMIVPVAVIWYLWLQTKWLARHLGTSAVRSVPVAVWTFVKAVAVATAIIVALR